MEGRVGANDFNDDNSSKEAQSLALSLDTISGATILPFDGQLQWILKYHLAMCSHMLQDYLHSQEVATLPLTLTHEL
jgi:hypothetical protein